MLPSFEGFGLLAGVALTNHSCAPNVRVDFPRGDWVAEARALRPLAAGEEVLQAYVDEDMDRKWRRKRLLLDYGFECNCTKCEDEQALDVAADA
mmetsp:Transcript_44898/g.129906  ORF Transcript_44898/g.129906 Transcript_44898/m.129906 type:complete len:94 (+) Transcript_44898:147-428(+)